MAAAGYTTDLTTLTTANSATQYAELTLAGWVDYGTQTAPDTDVFIQGTACTTFAFKTGLGGAMYNAGSGVTVPTDGAFLIWHYHAAPNTLAVEASGGIRGIAGNSLSAFYGWNLLGSDTYTYGGWNCFAFTPAVAASVTGGTPTGVYQYIGIANNQPGTVNRGNPVAIDALRYGRCALVVSGGDTGGSASFTGAAAVNDLIDNRWGLFQAIEGGYKWQGLMLFGSGSNPVFFYGANTSIVVANTKKVTSNFNTIEVRNTGSKIRWVAVTMQALGTASRGRWVTTDNAQIELTNCTFTDMSTFKFQSSSSLANTTFRRCEYIDQSGSTIDGGTFDSCYGTSSIISNAPNLITNCTFVSDGNNHAIQITTSGSCTFAGHSFSGYVAGTGTSSTGNEVVYNTSGGSVTISVTSGDAPSVRNSGSSTTTIVTGQKTLTLTGLVSGSEVRIYPSGSTTELAGIEESNTTFQYTYTYVSDQDVNVVVFALNYLPIFLPLVLGGSDASVPIQQVRDRQYLNPPGP